MEHALWRDTFLIFESKLIHPQSMSHILYVVYVSTSMAKECCVVLNYVLDALFKTNSMAQLFEQEFPSSNRFNVVICSHRQLQNHLKI